MGDGPFLARHDGRAFHHFTEGEGYRGKWEVNAIHEFPKGVLWICSPEASLTRYNGTSFRTFGPADGFAEWVNSLTVDPSGVFWMGNYEGVRRYDGSNVIAYTMEHGLPHNSVGKIHIDSDKTVWIATSSALSRVDGTSFINHPHPDSGLKESI